MRSVIARKVDAAVRFTLAHGLGRIRGDILINEYPKSGGSWIGQMLSRLLNMPFPRNRRPTLQPCFLHGHYLSTFAVPRTLVVWRDGRDVIVSWYFHSLFKNERENAPLVDRVRPHVPFDDYENVRANLPAFIEYSFTRQRHPRFSWADFVCEWADAEVSHIRYEEMRRDPAPALIRLAKEFAGVSVPNERAAQVAEEFSFERQAGRAPGKEDPSSFMRKGIVGDWENQFTREAREVFDHYAGEALINAGYEYDRSWVNG